MSAEQLGPDLSSSSRIHVVGVGGAGMSAIALVLAQMGHRVSGSDLRPSPVLEQLARAGVEVAVGHDAEQLGAVDWVTASPAVPASNPELAAAEAAGIPFWRRAAVMGALTRLKRTLAVAGTHGKTTTSSMLALIALEAGAAPSFLIGAELSDVGANARWGSGDLLVMEADESYGSFAELEPAWVGVTNVEPDHLDHYGSVQELEAAFVRLVERSSEGGIVLADDAGAARVGAASGALRVGMGPEVERGLSDIALGRASSSFTMRLSGSSVGLRVAAAGLHNVRNAAVAAALADAAGIGPEDIRSGLARFTGVPRRYEFRGEAAGVTFIDDYAHLPAEVAATLQAAGAGGFGRIVAVFQPHRFTRTQAVASSFAGAFAGATLVFVTDIYASGEAPIPGVTGRLVAEAGSEGLPAGSLRYVPELAVLADELVAELRPGDLCLTMGAGDLTELPALLLERLR
jgi:UDP-N-acetylmuramate--alanine ligase